MVRAVRRSWKSSSGVQEVEETRSFVEPERREGRCVEVRGQVDRKVDFSAEVRGWKCVGGRSWRG